MHNEGLGGNSRFLDDQVEVYHDKSIGKPEHFYNPLGGSFRELYLEPCKRPCTMMKVARHVLAYVYNGESLIQKGTLHAIHAERKPRMFVSVSTIAEVFKNSKLGKCMGPMQNRQSKRSSFSVG
ncbi:hypothetical protein VNO77_26863 [Canavalia gladiata]|uniref:Uncharacterized protein n=1 Tax=Canavalia gladiata TaxID=3824 RepID=A0AAN9Q5Y3_CANGL